VKRGLVERPEQWMWSSFRAYCYGETGPVRVKFQEWALGIKRRPVQSLAEVESPLIRKSARTSGAPGNYLSIVQWFHSTAFRLSTRPWPKSAMP
jgi:hypothetical protein